MKIKEISKKLKSEISSEKENKVLFVVKHSVVFIERNQYLVTVSKSLLLPFCYDYNI